MSTALCAEVLGVPWEKCDVIWGNTSKNLPWTCVSGGSQTTHAMTRAAHAVAMDARTEAAGNRSQDVYGGKPERVRSCQRTRLPQGRRQEHDAGAGGATRHPTGRHLRRPRGARRRQQIHQGFHRGTGGTGTGGGGQGQVSARRPDVSPTSQASRKSKSISKPASTTSRIFLPSPTWAR